jgi:integrase
MRLRESFSLYKRKLASGKVVYYYQCYDATGQRLCGRSTGKSTKTAAREYCNELLKTGSLIPLESPGGRCPTVAEFAKDFWDYDKSEYVRSRKGRGNITESYVIGGASVTKHHIIPVFGKRRLDTITQSEIDSWLTSYKDRKLKPASANRAFERLFTMMNWAVFKKIIKYNPCIGIKKLVEEKKKVEVLTMKEMALLFPNDYANVWDHRIYCILYMLAACTGMRIGELIGLRGCSVFDNCILVEGQFQKKYGFKDTKTHATRTIPVPPKMMDELNYLKQLNGQGYLFSENGGAEPVGLYYVNKNLRKALERIGIKSEEQKRRNLTNHSFR